MARDTQQCCQLRGWSPRRLTWVKGAPTPSESNSLMRTASVHHWSWSLLGGEALCAYRLQFTSAMIAASSVRRVKELHFSWNACSSMLALGYSHSQRHRLFRWNLGWAQQIRLAASFITPKLTPGSSYTGAETIIAGFYHADFGEAIGYL